MTDLDLRTLAGNPVRNVRIAGGSSVFHFSPFILFPAVLGLVYINPYPTAFPYGNGMVLHFYQQQESSTTKTVHKVIKKGLKMYV